MLLADPLTSLLALLLAIGLDALLGEPAWLWRRLPHPVVLLGRLIGWLDQRLFDPERSPGRQRLAGVLALCLLLSTCVLVGGLVHAGLAGWSSGWIVEGCLMATLIAWRSLVRHVEAVRRGLLQGLPEGRRAVSAIVGRDPEALDAAGVGRAAVESLAENFSDGVVAPIFYALLLGLPGLLLYKAVNTADSMIGHRSRRYLHCGWAAARLDDHLNLVPARLSGALIAVSGLLSGRFHAAWQSMRRTAGLHRSPNAGWPEAAVAGALDLRLAGPRVYHGSMEVDGWMGEGSPDVGPGDIERAIRLCRNAYLILIAALLGLAAILFFLGNSAA
ncbi:adenosylcobinamide-phosphate synthase [Arboricoccus pini]|uniref:Cobalamin biosynthesis protein CobD n=1 Tax=Arboricoccus pini TaxID=1963835 RepID=A0A212QXL0_9PROT|nr:adenosylcobinamide-phosphate synthase CbiB [Arboricoccus pini]SNB64474.1 adenosylcobinamide-phosphate synthase [Arboricoccus pini]